LQAIVGGWATAPSHPPRQQQRRPMSAVARPAGAWSRDIGPLQSRAASASGHGSTVKITSHATFIGKRKRHSILVLIVGRSSFSA